MADQDKWSNSIRDTFKGALAAGALVIATPAQAHETNITRVQQTEEIQDADIQPEILETYSGETVPDFNRERALVTERYISNSRRDTVQTRRNLSSKDMRTSTDKNTQVLYCIAKEIAAKSGQEGTFAVYGTDDRYSTNEVMWRYGDSHVSATVYTKESQGQFHSPEIVGIMKGIKDMNNRSPHDGNYVYFDENLKEVPKPNSAGPSPTNDMLREILKDAKQTCDKTFASTSGPKTKVAASLGQFKPPV